MGVNSKSKGLSGVDISSRVQAGLESLIAEVELVLSDIISTSIN